MQLDLSAPAPASLHSQPRELVLKDGRGAPLGDPPATLLVVGCYSDDYVQKQREVTLRLFARSGKAQDDALAKARRDDAGLDILIASVKGWRNVLEGGQPAEFSEAKLRVLLKGYPFVRDQLELFIHTDRNFTQGGSPTSPAGPSSDSPSTTPTP